MRDAHRHWPFILSHKKLQFQPDVFPHRSVILCTSEDGFSRRIQIKVFIADNSKAIVERLTDLLEEVPGAHLAGHAGDVPETVLRIQEMKPDALILDLQMPGGTGLDVLRAIGTGHPHLYVLICTNYPYPQYREECMSAEANLP